MTVTDASGMGEWCSESRVLIIVTGGTICMRQSPLGYVPATGFLDSCLAIRPSFNDHSKPRTLEVAISDTETKQLPSLRTPITHFNKKIRFSVLEFDPLLDSSSINAEGWKKIAFAIRRNYRRFDAFIVLHGTDSLAYSSSALSFMLSHLGKTVILTGSQVPMSSLKNDGTDNLIGSLLIAGHFVIPEVCLFFNNTLFRGNRATKVSATSFAAFESPNFPPLATVGIGIDVRWDLIHRPTELEAFHVDEELGSHVACLRVFPGILPEMIEGVLKMASIKGLVLETFGAGNAPEDAMLLQVLEEASRRGVVIVNVTQCLVGTVSPLYAPATRLGRAGVAFGNDLTSEAALTKLIWLLGKGKNLTHEEICNKISTSMRGEITETSKSTVFRHPGLPHKLEALNRIGYAITEGNIKTIGETIEPDREWLLNEMDYAGATPLHQAAKNSNTDVLRYLLSRGASVHIRNKDNHTPLFLAADAGIVDNVQLLVNTGAHLDQEEMGLAMLSKNRVETYMKTGAAEGLNFDEQRMQNKIECWSMIIGA